MNNIDNITRELLAFEIFCASTSKTDPSDGISPEEAWRSMEPEVHEAYRDKATALFAGLAARGVVVKLSKKAKAAEALHTLVTVPAHPAYTLPE